MKDLNLPCRDVRTREVGIQEIHNKVTPDHVELIRRDYYANGGWEKQEVVMGGAFGADGEQFYYIVPTKCTECTGFHEEPQCAAVCPVDCCVPNEDVVETEEQLLAKKDRLHL